MRLSLLSIIILPLILSGYFVKKARAEKQSKSAIILPFGENGKFKMLYDCRQRPQSVFLKDRLYIVYNGDAKPTRNGKGNAYPLLITYDPRNRSFSKPIRLGLKSSSDHH